MSSPSAYVGPATPAPLSRTAASMGSTVLSIGVGGTALGDGRPADANRLGGVPSTHGRATCRATVAKGTPNSKS